MKKNSIMKKKELVELFFMATEQVSVKQLSGLITDQSITVELWDELNIMELELSNQNQVDFEMITTGFSEPEDTIFLEKHNIKTIYAVTLEQSDLAIMKPYFAKLVENFGGLVCSDTQDFKPIIVV